MHFLRVIKKVISRYINYLKLTSITETTAGPTTTWKAEAIPVQETQQNTVLLVLVLVVCVASIFACFAMAALCYRYIHVTKSRLTNIYTTTKYKVWKYLLKLYQAVLCY